MPFFMVDPFLVVTHLNEHMEKLTGYTRSEVVGRMTCGELLNTVQCHTCDCVLKQVMVPKKPFSGLRRVVRDRDGREIPVTVSASIITDPDGPGHRRVRGRAGYHPHSGSGTEDRPAHRADPGRPPDGG